LKEIIQVHAVVAAASTASTTSSSNQTTPRDGQQQGISSTTLPLQQEFRLPDFKFYDVTISPNSRQFGSGIAGSNMNLTTPRTKQSAFSLNLKPSQLAEQQKLQAKKEQEEEEKRKKKQQEDDEKRKKKQQEEEERRKSEEKEHQRRDELERKKREHELEKKKMEFAIACLQKFAVKWREKAKEMVTTTTEARYRLDDSILLNQLMYEQEGVDLLEQYVSKTVFVMDFNFYNEVIDFVEEKDVGESCLMAKALIERYVKKLDFDLYEDVRSKIQIDYAQCILHPTKHLFAPAINQVRQRLEENIIAQFVQTEAYKAFEEKKKAGNSKRSTVLNMGASQQKELKL